MTPPSRVFNTQTERRLQRGRLPGKTPFPEGTATSGMLNVRRRTQRAKDEMEKCLACSLTDGTLDLPGGRIYATTHWVVEHCIGPLGVGTLMVKPFRHCLHVWELTDEESRELGPLLRLVTTTIRAILKPDQIYVCLWSHASWEPGHLHFVLQPSWNDFRREHERPGPFLQVDMFKARVEPARLEVEAFAARAREVIGELALSVADPGSETL